MSDNNCEKFIELVKEWNRSSSRVLNAAVITYGCQQNVSDSEILRGMLEKMGYSLIDKAEDADVVIFNTCAVREHAELKVYGNIGALNLLKKENLI